MEAPAVVGVTGEDSSDRTAPQERDHPHRSEVAVFSVWSDTVRRVMVE